jgi:DNA-directed RNA polymerase specialized sigma24 family protein
VYGRVWESEEVALLRAQRKLGVPLRETAKQLGRSYSAVKSYASDHGILPDAAGAWSPAEDACLLVLARKGHTVVEISQLMDRSERAIRQRLVRLKLKLSHLRALGPVAST